jgi:hypothetical protein
MGVVLQGNGANPLNYRRMQSGGGNNYAKRTTIEFYSKATSYL